MSNVILKLKTGFVNAIHEEDTGMSREEWQALSYEQKSQWFNEMICDYIETYACDEETGEIIE